MNGTNTPAWVTPMARIGLTAKGIVYCLIGVLAFMAAFHWGGHSTRNADATGALQSIEALPGGKGLLLVVGIGLLCYAAWRLVEAFTHKNKEDKKAKQWGQVLRYGLSGAGYLILGIAAIRMALQAGTKGSGNNNQDMASGLLSQPMGQWLLGLVALVFIGVGIYQIFYAMTEKYKKHLSSMQYSSEISGLLIKSGKAGYVARGVVWLIVGWMLLKASMQNNAAAAGDTAKAFSFLQHGTYGTLLLGIIAAGVICYGIFCFVRARYERIS